MHKQVLGIKGIGTVQIKIRDDLNQVDILELNEVLLWYLPDAPLNIFMPQAFIQQWQSKGDPHAKCTISATGIDLEWTDQQGKQTYKYVPLNKSNIGICFTTSGYKNFSNFAALLGIPAMYVSDDEGEDDISISSPPNKTDIIMTSAPAEQDVP